MGDNMNESGERKSGAVLSYFSIIISTVVQLVYTPFLIRMLGQSEYGLYSLVASIIGYLTVLDLGFGNAVVVYTAKYRAQGKYEEEKKLHGMFSVIFIILGVIVGLLGLILFFNVNNLFGATMTNAELSKAKIMMLILTFNLAITFPFSVYSSIISAYEKFTYQKVLSILNTILKPVLMIPLLFLGYKSIALCVILTVINIATLLTNYLYCRTKLNIKIKFLGFNKVLFWEILGYSLFIFLGVVVDKVNWSVDQFILGAVSGTIAVSVYAVAAQINTLFINLSTAIGGVMLPKMSKMIASNSSNEEITDEFIKVGRLQCYIIFLMVTGFILVGKEFITAWAGVEYLDAYYILVILITPAFFSLIQSLGISIMQAKNMHKFRSVLLFCIALVNIIISIPLAKTYQGIGSAIGTSLAVIVGNIIIMNFYYYYKVKINVLKFWKTIASMVIKFALPLIVSFLISKFIHLSGFGYVFVVAIIYTILYVLTSYFLVMNDYEKYIVNSVFRKIFRKKVNHESIN